MKKNTPNWAKFLCFALLSTALLTLPAARAAGPVGMYAFLCGSSGNAAAITPAFCNQMASAGVGWLRCEMVLPSTLSSWDSGTLSRYDTAVNNAKAAGLDIIMLIDRSSWRGSSSAWNANANEVGGGNGDNAYIDAFAAGASQVLIQHFHDRVKVYEIWNEPWDTSTGAGFIQPSCLSWLQTKSWIASHVTLGYGDVNVIIGDGHDGAYLNSVYVKGTSSAVNSFKSAKTSYGTYPVDGFAQHYYQDPCGGPGSDVTAYINGMRNVYTTYEGSGTSKGTYITEFGWNQYYMQHICGQSLATAQANQASSIHAAFGAFNTAAHGSYVKGACLFNWQDAADDGTGNSAGFGLLNSGGGQKPDYSTYLGDSTYQGRYTTAGSLDNNILNYWSSHGQAVLGNPYDYNGGGAFVHVNSAGGFTANIQDYSGGSNGHTRVFDSSTGTHGVSDLNGIWSYFLGHGDLATYGTPKNDEYYNGAGYCQDFSKSTTSSIFIGDRPWQFNPSYAGNDGGGQMQIFLPSQTAPYILGSKYQTNGPSSGWNNWGSFGISNIVGMPSVGYISDGRLQVYVVATNGNVWTAWKTVKGGAWTSWNNYGGSLVGRVAVGYLPSGAIQLFGRSTSNTVVTLFSGSGGWIDFGGSCYSDPSVGCNANGEIQVFTRSSSNTVQSTWKTGTSDSSAWSNWTDLGGSCYGKVAVGYLPSGTLQIFYRSGANTVGTLWENGVNSTSWTSSDQGGNCYGDVITGGNANGEIYYFYPTSTGTIEYQNKTGTSDSSGWSGLQSLGGSYGSVLCVGNNGTRNMQLFMRDPSGVVQSTFQSGPNGTFGTNNWSNFGTW